MKDGNASVINRRGALRHTCDPAFPIGTFGQLMWPVLRELEHAAHLPLMSLWSVLQRRNKPDPCPDIKRYEIPLLLPLPESTHPAHPFMNSVDPSRVAVRG